MINIEIKEAIEESVRNEGQSQELAKKIIVWIENLCDGNELISDRSAYTKRCKLCFESVISFGQLSNDEVD